MYVGNLSFKADEDIISTHFGSCGPVLKVDRITDYTTGKFYGTAFVEFATPDAARRAVALNGQKFLGRPLKVELPKKRGDAPVERIEKCCSVFVSRLPLSIAEEDLRAEFGKAGEIVNVRWVNNRRAGAPVCCCFVQYLNEDMAVEAVKMFDDKEALDSHGTLRVNLAPDRPFCGPSNPATNFGPEEEEEGPVDAPPQKQVKRF